MVPLLTLSGAKAKPSAPKLSVEEEALMRIQHGLKLLVGWARFIFFFFCVCVCVCVDRLKDVKPLFHHMQGGQAFHY